MQTSRNSNLSGTILTKESNRVLRYNRPSNSKERTIGLVDNYRLENSLRLPKRRRGSKLQEKTHSMGTMVISDMGSSKEETYISIDVETLGPVPGNWAMVELGACALSGQEFSACIMPEPDGIEPETKKFWDIPSNKPKLDAIFTAGIHPHMAMAKFNLWLKQFKNPVLAGFPAAFDFPFVHYYWWHYLGFKPPFGHRALDIKTLAMTLLGCGYKEAAKRRLKKAFPECFSRDLPHTHRALDDAREQAFLLKGLLKRAEHMRDTARQWVIEDKAKYQ